MAIRAGSSPSMLPDWGWFAAHALDDLRQGRVGVFINPHEPGWFQGAYAWLYGRASGDQRQNWPAPLAPPRAPPRHFVPVLAGRDNGSGQLGFVAVRFDAAPCADPRTREEEAAVRAADIPAAWYRVVTSAAHWPCVEMHLPQCEGESLALSAFVAALSTSLDQPVASDVAFVGCLEGREGRPIFCPADGAYMAAKIAVADAWGYRRIMVVTGQSGIPAAALPMIHFLPEDPAEAATDIFATAMAAGASAQAQARLLAVLDQALLRTAPLSPRRMEKLLEVTAPFIQAHSAALPRHLAHDLRSRAFLHVGDTQSAAAESAAAAVAQPRAVDLRDAFTSNYIKYQERAHRSVLIVDQGYFQDTHPDHIGLDAALTRRLAALDCGEADIVDLYMAVIMTNTRARRWMFQGRWERNAQRSTAAYQEFGRFAAEWSPLFAWCRHAGMPDGTQRRQENQCIEALADCALFARSLPGALRQSAKGLWPAGVAAADAHTLNCFDGAAWIRWHVLLKMPMADEAITQLLATAQREARRLGGGYPSFLVPEWILRGGVGSAQQRALAGELLLTSDLFRPDLKPTSVLTILAMRAESLLSANGFSPPAPVRPQPGTKLAEVGAALLAEPATLVERCPY